MGPRFTGDTPRDVGLLAHELTHIARARQPRFVPPVARMRHARQVGFQGEEDIARGVESRVTTLVTSPPAARVAPGATPTPPAAEGPVHLSPDGEPGHPADALEPTPASSQREQDEWGGLPAPWEPLPDWVTSDPPSPELPASLRPPSSAPVIATEAAPVSSWVGGGVSTVVHAADESRALDSPAPGAPPPAGDAAPEESAPDIDWLARQVYSALKRRLGAEARRENLL